MQKSKFDNLPCLTKEEAFNILSTPIEKLNLASDYYKAVFHLNKYPGADTEKVLRKLIESDANAQPLLIAKRKAVEVLARLKCFNAIPSIGLCLEDSDPYLVENAAWALCELGCKDNLLIKKIAELLDDPMQNRRVLIQSLAGLGALSEVSKIKLFLEDDSYSPGICGASIAAIKKLSGESIQTYKLENFLALNNQNDRQCAVLDVIQADEIKLLPAVLKSPVSPAFRLKAIDILWQEKRKLNGYDLIDLIDSTIKDDPNNLDLKDDLDQVKTERQLIEELFATDFKRAYIALRTLLSREVINIWPPLVAYLNRIKRDYGALYFFMILFRSVKGWEQPALKEIKLIAFSCLSKSWPDYIKFKPAAILTLMQLYPSSCYSHIGTWLTHSHTPFWVTRYSALIGLEAWLKDDQCHYLLRDLKYLDQDPHRFVRSKAKSIQAIYT